MASEIFDAYGQNPIVLYKQWLSEASESEPNDPEAVCLATATKDGRPSARMVLVKEISENGIKFHTNAESRKGKELLENPYGALCIHWKTTRKQIRIEGRVEAVGDEESDAYFETRPIERQIGAWASKQSQPFEKRAELEAAVEKYRGEFAEENNIPRPPYWKGFRLKPESFEFWDW